MMVTQAILVVGRESCGKEGSRSLDLKACRMLGQTGTRSDQQMEPDYTGFRFTYHVARPPCRRLELFMVECGGATGILDKTMTSVGYVIREAKIWCSYVILTIFDAWLMKIGSDGCVITL